MKASRGYRDWNDVNGDRAAFLAVMSQLCSMYKGQQAAALNKSDLALWFGDLNAWPLDDIAEAIKLWRWDSDFMPRVSNIRRLLKVAGSKKDYFLNHDTGRYEQRPLLTAQVTEKGTAPPPKEFREALVTMKRHSSRLNREAEAAAPGWTEEHKQIEEELDRQATGEDVHENLHHAQNAVRKDFNDEDAAERLFRAEEDVRRQHAKKDKEKNANGQE